MGRRFLLAPKRLGLQKVRTILIHWNYTGIIYHSSNLVFEGIFMSKQRMIVTDDQLLIDMELLFNAIREADGDWQAVEKDMYAYLAAVQAMSGATPEEN